MIKFFRELFSKNRPNNECYHVFELLEKISREIEVHAGRSYTVEDVYIYCPKCRNRVRVTPLEWRLIQKEQKIDADFIKRNDIHLGGM